MKLLIALSLFASSVGAATVTLTMPTTYENGDLLPLDEPLPVIIWKEDTLLPVGIDLALPGADVEIDIDDDYGCYRGTAWTLNIDDQLPLAQSIKTAKACKAAPTGCGSRCHL